MSSKEKKYESYISHFPESKDNKGPKILDIFAFFLVLTPILIGSVFIAFNHYIIGILIFVICWGLLPIAGTMRRKIIVKKFFRISNAHTKVNVINVEDVEVIKELYNNSALTFIEGPSDELLDYIYNWLNNEKVLKNESLNVYTFNGYILKNVYKYSKFSNDTLFTCVFLKVLDLNDSNKERFFKNRFYAGARWLDDIVDNDKIL